MTCIDIGGKGRRRSFICGDFGDESTYTKKLYNAPNCPNEDNHTPGPWGYVDWFSWARRMGRTHRQTRCPGCDLLAVWGADRAAWSAQAWTDGMTSPQRVQDRRRLYLLQESSRPRIGWQGRVVLVGAWMAAGGLVVVVLGIVAALVYGLFLLAQNFVRSGASW